MSQPREKVSHPAPDRMTVVFATYQSIQVISDAQKQRGLPEFGLIICDEAHRTTDATLEGEDDNAANLEYPKLDGRIRETYAARTRMLTSARFMTATSVRSAGLATASGIQA